MRHKCGEAGAEREDVARPVDGHADGGADAVSARRQEHPGQPDDRVEEAREADPDPPAAPEPGTVPQQDESRRGTYGHADDPRELDSSPVADALDEQKQRSPESRRSEDCVLEHAQSAYANGCLARRQAGVAHHLVVDREAAAGHEDAETGRHRRAHVTQLEVRALVGARQLAVGDEIAEVAHDSPREREREPDPARVREVSRDLAEACRPGDAYERSGRERGGDGDRDQHLTAPVIPVVTGEVFVKLRLIAPMLLTAYPSHRQRSLRT